MEMALSPFARPTARTAAGFRTRCAMLFDAIEQTIDPRPRCVTVERPASQAWTVSGKQRLLRHREELDILWLRLPRGTRRLAEDPGRAHAEIEHAVVRRIGALIRALHLVTMWQRNRRGRG